MVVLKSPIVGDYRSLARWSVFNVPARDGPWIYGVGGRTQQAVVQVGQRLLQVGRLELLEDRLHPFEATDAGPQPGQFRQRRLGAAAAVEQAVDLLDHLAEGPQLPEP